MEFFTSVVILSILVCANASVLNTTNIGTVLAGATAQSVLMIPAEYVHGPSLFANFSENQASETRFSEPRAGASAR